MTGVLTFRQYNGGVLTGTRMADGRVSVTGRIVIGAGNETEQLTFVYAAGP